MSTGRGKNWEALCVELLGELIKKKNSLKLFCDFFSPLTSSKTDFHIWISAPWGPEHTTVLCFSFNTRWKAWRKVSRIILSFPPMFSVALTTFRIKTVAFQNEAEIVYSVRKRWRGRTTVSWALWSEAMRINCWRGKTHIHFVSPVWFHWFSSALLCCQCFS